MPFCSGISRAQALHEALGFKKFDATNATRAESAPGEEGEDSASIEVDSAQSMADLLASHGNLKAAMCKEYVPLKSLSVVDLLAGQKNHTIATLTK